MQGPLPAVWEKPQYRRMQMPARQRRALGGAEGLKALTAARPFETRRKPPLCSILEVSPQLRGSPVLSAAFLLKTLRFACLIPNGAIPRRAPAHAALTTI